MIRYTARITKDDPGYMVEFPDLPGCFSDGETVEEALINAKEALAGRIISMLSRDMAIADPTNITGKNVYPVEPEPGTAFALTLRKERKARGWTRGVTAEKPGIRYQSYQRIEDSVKSNPTLKTIKRLETVPETTLI